MKEYRVKLRIEAEGEKSYNYVAEFSAVSIGDVFREMAKDADWHDQTYQDLTAGSD